MISNHLHSNAISTYSQPLVDGELVANAAATAEAVQWSDHAGFVYDGAIDLRAATSATAIDQMADESRSLLAKLSWKKETLAPMEVAVKQMLSEIARHRGREEQSQETVRRREEASQSVTSNLQKAADALAGMRSSLLQP